MPMTGEISLKDIQMLISINSPILRDSLMDFYRDAQTMDDGDFSDRLAMVRTHSSCLSVF